MLQSGLVQSRASCCSLERETRSLLACPSFPPAAGLGLPSLRTVPAPLHGGSPSADRGPKITRRQLSSICKVSVTLFARVRETAGNRAGKPATRSGKGPGCGPRHLSRRFPPGDVSGFLTSDSRRWLRNASRPLGAPSFPLPPLPLLPLSLAGEPAAPGAAGSSMLGQFPPAARLRGSLQQLRDLCPGRPSHSARPDPGPAPSASIGCDYSLRLRPVLRLADQSGRGWGSFKEYYPLTPQAFLLHFAGGWLLEFWILSSGSLAPRSLLLSALSGPT